jgi:hypothetical protein
MSLFTPISLSFFIFEHDNLFRLPLLHDASLDGNMVQLPMPFLQALDDDAIVVTPEFRSIFRVDSQRSVCKGKVPPL